jgi:hypothetical protein
MDGVHDGWFKLRLGWLQQSFEDHDGSTQQAQVRMKNRLYGNALRRNKLTPLLPHPRQKGGLEAPPPLHRQIPDGAFWAAPCRREGE